MRGQSCLRPHPEGQAYAVSSLVCTRLKPRSRTCANVMCKSIELRQYNETDLVYAVPTLRLWNCWASLSEQWLRMEAAMEQAAERAPVKAR